MALQQPKKAPSDTIVTPNRIEGGLSVSIDTLQNKKKSGANVSGNGLTGKTDFAIPGLKEASGSDDSLEKIDRDSLLLPNP